VGGVLSLSGRAYHEKMGGRGKTKGGGGPGG